MSGFSYLEYLESIETSFGPKGFIRIMSQEVNVSTTHGSGSESEHVKKAVVSLPLRNARSATLALHADKTLKVVDDIAPPIHVSTTYEYPDEPERLLPFYGREFGVSKHV